MKFNLIATSVFGLESEVSYELRKLGYTEQKGGQGQIVFPGDALPGPRSQG